MKIISWNVNGIRAVFKRNFLKWLRESEADIVCLQETKAWPEQLEPELVNPKGYFSFFNSAQKKGYAGLAVYAKRKPLKIETKAGIKRFDEEGRILKIQYPDFLLINLYLPHGGRQKENMGYKLKSYDYLLKYLKKIKNEKVILIGDFNVAHQEIDLARPKDNKNNTMFTLEERKRIDKIIEFGFSDTFRKFHKEPGNYTWWPYYRNARQRNLGWRIDYIFTSKALTPKVKKAFILKNVKGSDHCPIGIEIKK
ncbi:MAG: exodeoxyribonuclease III [Minisyncoccales bacterium]